MAFTTRRGRPKAPATTTDLGTPELRLKHALGATTEPIDLCLSRELITPEQHRCGMHLRWLYTLRYGAPVITTRYGDRLDAPAASEESDGWRASREEEYHTATALLKQHRRYDAVMRVCIYHELPACLNPVLRARAWGDASLTDALWRSHHRLREGLDILHIHWRAPLRKIVNQA